MDHRNIYRANRETGVFEPIDFMNLEIGDIFEMYESDGEFVGCYTAQSDPEMVNGIGHIHTMEYHDH